MHSVGIKIASVGKDDTKRIIRLLHVRIMTFSIFRFFLVLKNLITAVRTRKAKLEDAAADVTANMVTIVITVTTASSAPAELVTFDVGNDMKTVLTVEVSRTEVMLILWTRTKTTVTEIEGPMTTQQVNRSMSWNPTSVRSVK